MKLLFDQNISYRIVRLIKENFPNSRHTKSVNLTDSDDIGIWEYARMQNSSY